MFLKLKFYTFYRWHKAAAVGHSGCCWQRQVGRGAGLGLLHSSSSLLSLPNNPPTTPLSRLGGGEPPLLQQPQKALRGEDSCVPICPFTATAALPLPAQHSSWQQPGANLQRSWQSAPLLSTAMVAEAERLGSAASQLLPSCQRKRLCWAAETRIQLASLRPQRVIWAAHGPSV